MFELSYERVANYIFTNFTSDLENITFGSDHEPAMHCAMAETTGRYFSPVKSFNAAQPVGSWE